MMYLEILKRRYKNLGYCKERPVIFIDATAEVADITSLCLFADFFELKSIETSSSILCLPWISNGIAQFSFDAHTLKFRSGIEDPSKLSSQAFPRGKEVNTLTIYNIFALTKCSL